MRMHKNAWNAQYLLLYKLDARTETNRFNSTVVFTMPQQRTLGVAIVLKAGATIN